jgi:hypothetical protein
MKAQELSDRIQSLVDEALKSLEQSGEITDRDIRSLESLNKIVSVLLEREKGKQSSDPFDVLSDDDLLKELEA